MSYSRTTIKELSAQYRAVLKKCFLLNAAILVGVSMTMPAVAAPTTHEVIIEDRVIPSESISGQEQHGNGFLTDADKAADGQGGVYLIKDGATVTISGSTYSNNANGDPAKAGWQADAATNENLDYGYGGVLFVQDNSTLNVNDTTFSNNSATWDGGAITSGQKTSVLKITNSHFNNNTVDQYSAGAVGIYGTAVISGSHFTENAVLGANLRPTDVDGGGAVYVGGNDTNVTITGSDFVRNTSANQGGAFATRSSNFTVNSQFKISDSRFEGNTAATNGGAIATAFTNLNNKISGTTFVDNEATNGGAIYNKGALTIENSTFETNTASALGGAIYNESALNISGSTFTSNTSTGGDGGAIRTNVKDGSVVNISNSKFSNNTALGYDAADSGAISIGNGDVNIVSSEFIGNKAKAAGAIYAYTGNNHYVKVSIKDSLFEGNEADSIGAVGNFASARNASSLTPGGMVIENTTFKNNKATDSTNSGAGALFLGSESQTKISGSTFIGNTSAVTGGAIATRENTLGNHSTAVLDITNTTFDGNTAATNGGAIFNTLYNDAANSGSASLTSITFANNSAANGGAIYNDGSGDKAGNLASLTITDSTFTKNIATTNGGAIYNSGILNLKGTNVFSGNTATGEGADIYNTGTVNIVSGKTTLDGGMAGTGILSVANGATVDIGATTNTMGTANFGATSTLQATLKNATSFGSLMASTWNVETGATLSLVVDATAVGSEYQIVGTDAFTLATNALYNISAVDGEAGKYSVAAKDAGNIANDIAASTGTALTGNQTAAVGALAGVDTSQTSDTIANIVTGLQSGDAATQAAAVKALAELTPSATPITQAVASDTQGKILSAVTSRLGTAGGDTVQSVGPWVQALYNHTRQNRTSGSTGFRGNTQGVAMGVDVEFNDVYKVGVGYAYSATDVKADTTKTDVYGHSMFLYAQYQPNRWYVNGTLTAGFSDYKEVNPTKTAKYDVNTFGGQAMTGYKVAGFDNKVGLRYLYIDNKEYTDSAGQKIKADDADLLTAVLGTSYSKDFKVSKNSVFTPEVRLAATYDMISDNSQTVITMLGGSAPYTTTGKRLPRFGVEAGVGMTMAVGPMDFSVNYDAGIRRDYLSQTGMLKLKYNF